MKIFKRILEGFVMFILFMVFVLPEILYVSFLESLDWIDERM